MATAHGYGVGLHAEASCGVLRRWRAMSNPEPSATASERGLPLHLLGQRTGPATERACLDQAAMRAAFKMRAQRATLLLCARRPIACLLGAPAMVATSHLRRLRTWPPLDQPCLSQGIPLCCQFREDRLAIIWNRMGFQ